MSKAQYESAPEEKLDLIISQAEDRLQAQLQIGVASDQRAMTFAGIVAALAAALVAVGAEKGVSLPVAVMLVLLLFSVGAALFAAQPVAWEIPGNTPASWVDDIADGTDDLKSAKAAMASFYAEMISDNARCATSTASLLRAALIAALLAPVFGAVALLFS